MAKSNYDRWETFIARPEFPHGTQYVAPARGAGKRWVNRAGRTVEVLPAQEEGLDADGMPWLAICTDHGCLVAVPTKASGIRTCRDTTDFCDECREAAKRQQENARCRVAPVVETRTPRAGERR